MKKTLCKKFCLIFLGLFIILILAYIILNDNYYTDNSKQEARNKVRCNC